jgi:hypothetical protein
MTFSCLEIQFSAQFVVAGPESAHLIVRIVCDGGVDGESLYLGSIFHRTDVEDMSPGLEFYRTLFRAGNGAASVCLFLQQEVGLAKYKPIGHFLYVFYVEFLSLNFSKFRSCSFLGEVNFREVNFREVIEVKEVITPFGRSEVKANSFGGNV